MRLKLVFAWYDLWIGLFVDRKEWGTRFYVFPLPCVGLRIDWPRRCPICGRRDAEIEHGPPRTGGPACVSWEEWEARQ